MSDNKKYWHEATQAEVYQLASKESITWGDIQKEYKQPDWCTYPDALGGMMGCWSLATVNPEGLRSKISNEWCNTCDCHISKTPNVETPGDNL